jgi:phenylpropionate dioxygenase-like ring-hydroxylating dioxygenase large terminal subunit
VARALRAVCPHRGSDLGQGRVVDGVLWCPFHGWRFDGGGRCIRILSRPAGEPIPDGAQVPSYPVREQQRLIWICMGEEAMTRPDPPSYPWWEEGEDRTRLQLMDRQFPAPFLAVA